MSKKLVLAVVAVMMAGWVYAASHSSVSGESKPKKVPTPRSSVPSTREMPRFAIMQGATDTRQTQVFVLTGDGGRYRFTLRDKRGKELSPFLVTSKKFWQFPVHDLPSAVHRTQPEHELCFSGTFCLHSEADRYAQVTDSGSGQAKSAFCCCLLYV